MKMIPALILWSSALVVYGQQALLDSVTKKFDTYRKQSPQEKIFVHLDRTNFLTGEVFWFRIYCVDGAFHKPNELSKIAYLEILDAANKPVLQNKVELKNGFGNSSLFLPATIPSGNFTVRGYTNWMKNFDPAFYFQQKISIINPFRKPELTTQKETHVYDAQFLGEGGSILAGEKNKIAFRVIDSRGKGVSFSGAVINQQKDTIVRFTPGKFGIGNFEITPRLDDRYQIVIRGENGKTSEYPFPEISAQGYQLRVADSTAGQVKISVRSRGRETDSPIIYLFIHTRQKIVKSETSFLRNGKSDFIFNKDLFGPGISHITLFNSALEPVSERLYFKHPDDKLMITAATDQQQYSVRRKVTLTLETSDQNKNLTTANLSVSVYKEDPLLLFARQHIDTHLLLSSDITGVVESPEYYFSEADGARKAIDNVMLTHGWRRFSWNSVLNETPAVHSYIPEYQGHIIQGNVRDESGAPARGITTYLASPSKLVRMYGSISDSQGKVRFVTKNFTGPKKMIFQTNWNRDSVYQLTIENPFSDKYTSDSPPPFSLSVDVEKQLVARSIAMQVQDIYYDDKVILGAKPLKDSSAFFGRADETYFLDDYTRFPVMEEVMREYVPGVWVRKRDGKFVFMVVDQLNKEIFRENPLIMVDGVPQFDVDRIMAFDPLKIEKLEVMTRKFYLGNLIFPGIVSYSTFSGDLAGFQPDPKSVVLDYEGLQLQREFYAPRYASQQQLDSRMPDQRNLLFWAPEVITMNGKATIEFYTADLSGTYSVNIEGITHQGVAGSFTTVMSVKGDNY